MKIRDHFVEGENRHRHPDNADRPTLRLLLPLSLTLEDRRYRAHKQLAAQAFYGTGTDGMTPEAGDINFTTRPG